MPFRVLSLPRSVGSSSMHSFNMKDNQTLDGILMSYEIRKIRNMVESLRIANHTCMSAQFFLSRNQIFKLLYVRQFQAKYNLFKNLEYLYCYMKNKIKFNISNFLIIVR